MSAQSLELIAKYLLMIFILPMHAYLDKADQERIVCILV